VEQELDRLFSLDPSQFISARDELAGRLKAVGNAEEAGRVKALRRPTVAAWAVNQVARGQPGDVEELLAAGADLRAVQRKVLSGVKAGGFRDAMDRRRTVVSKLTKAAERVLRDSGHGSAGVVEAVGATFEAASLDQEAAELVRAGRLSKELPAPSGFGEVPGLELVPPPKEEKPAAKDRAKQDDRAAARRAAEREARELADAAAKARRQAIKARGEADRLVAKAERLMDDAEQARTDAREAATKAKKAEEQAVRDQARADRAAKAAEKLGS
jgi:hypothetical protein